MQFGPVSGPGCSAFAGKRGRGIDHAPDLSPASVHCSISVAFVFDCILLQRHDAAKANA